MYSHLRAPVLSQYWEPGILGFKKKTYTQVILLQECQSFIEVHSTCIQIHWVENSRKHSGKTGLSPQEKQEQKTGIDCPGAKQKDLEVPLLGTKASICISKAQQGVNTEGTQEGLTYTRICCFLYWRWDFF